MSYLTESIAVLIKSLFLLKALISVFMDNFKILNIETIGRIIKGKMKKSVYLDASKI